MSQPDSPPESDQPGEPGPAATQPPWSPYPDGWDAPTPKAPPSPTPAGSAGLQNPYGEPAPYAPSNPYAASPASAYGQTLSHPAAPTVAPAFGFGGYASWLARVAAHVIDSLVASVAALPAWLALFTLGTTSTTVDPATGVTTHGVEYGGVAVSLIVIGAGLGLLVTLWNVGYRQGRTGASIGKSVLAIRLVNAETQPIGMGWSVLREVVSTVVNNLCCGLGYFWPIWDSHKQTFADKIMSTYVISATTPPPRVY